MKIETQTQTPTPRIPENLQSQTDTELVHAAREGVKWAFVEIVARYQATVSGVALAILRDFAASEDAAQETFLTAWKKIGEIRDPGKLRSWLATIARTTALGQLRRRKPSESLDAEIADEAKWPDEATASNEEKALVISTLDGLPEKYRVPLVLFYREGKSVRAVAEALELTEVAAKKRLSRGREMLRDKVASQIDSVLGRTLPTAVFTMSVAGAIGALGQPSAIAATAFSTASIAQATTATTATTAATTASTATTTAVTTSKITLATAAAIAVACFPIGYQARAWSKPEPAAVAAPGFGTPDSEPADDATKLPDSALVAEWIRLHEEHGSGTEALPDIHAAILAKKNQFQRRALLAALAAEWAEVSPESGLRFYAANGQRGWQLDLFANEWVVKKGWDAMDGIRQMPGWKKWSRDALPRLMESLLPHLETRDPAALARFLERLPNPGGYWDTDVREAMAVAVAENSAHVRAAAEQITGPNRKQALEGVALAWAAIDGPSAMQWAQTQFKGAESSDLVRFVLTGWAETDPVAALNRMQEIPAQSEDLPDSRTTTATMVLEAAAEANIDVTLDWLRENPASVSSSMISDLDGAFRDRLSTDTLGFLSRLHSSGTLMMLMPCIENSLLNDASVANLEILDWIAGQEKSAELKRLESAAIAALAHREPVATVEYLDRKLEKDPSARVDHAVRNLFNGGELLDRLDVVLPVASPKLQQELLSIGFTYLQEEFLSNPGVWLERLEVLEKDDRSQGVIFLARAWAGRDPLAVADWLERLADPGERASGYEAVAWQWAKTDAPGASEWLSDLPAGSDRDASILGLVTTIAKGDPDDAWVWVGNIDGGKARVRAAKAVLRPLNASDPARARAMLDEAQAAFPPAEMEDLSALFE